MQVLDHDDARRGAALGNDEIAERASHLIAHQDRVLPGGPELDALRVREPDARDLAEELRDPSDVRLGHVAGDAGAELLLAHDERLASADARAPAEEPRDEREGRALAHRVATGEQDLGATLAKLPEDLRDEARLTRAGEARHQDRPRDRLVHALVVEREERR